jgi:hypothetical protein
MHGRYATWSDWLDRFARGEDPDRSELPQMSGEQLGATAAERFSRRCEEAVNRRLDLWTISFRAACGHARSIEDFRFVMKDARRRLDPLRDLIASELVFDSLRDALSESVESALDGAQTDLEDSARRAGDQTELILKIVRDQPLTRAVALDLAPDGSAPPMSTTAGRGPRRVLA